ncbi:hypothetical protein BZG36_00834 [Bifiguratus adelaidae]|uniref:Uncharacterized protein n=1 Tax=Bifiguratus adelaidae TaxID=1938954 RepID=A0A261Y6I5_9FUNG|nr:hypothetical protein BZG36_00834 [Bifiguratus adelaidae]
MTIGDGNDKSKCRQHVELEKECMVSLPSMSSLGDNGAALVAASWDRDGIKSPSSLQCCCGKEDCRHLNAFKQQARSLESKLTAAAEIGQALLQQKQQLSETSERALAEVRKERDEAERRYASARSDLEALQVQYDQATKESDSRHRYIQKLEKTIATLHSDLDRVSADHALVLEQKRSTMSELERLRVVEALVSQGVDGKEALMAQLEDYKQEIAIVRRNEIALEAKNKKATARHEQLQHQYEKLKREHQILQSAADRYKDLSWLKESNEKLRNDVLKLTSTYNTPAADLQSNHLINMIKELAAANHKHKTEIVELKEMLADARTELDEVREHTAVSSKEENDSVVTERDPLKVGDSLLVKSTKADDSLTQVSSSPSQPASTIIHHHYHYHVHGSNNRPPSVITTKVIEHGTADSVPSGKIQDISDTIVAPQLSSSHSQTNRSKRTNSLLSASLSIDLPGRTVACDSKSPKSPTEKSMVPAAQGPTPRASNSVPLSNSSHSLNKKGLTITAVRNRRLTNDAATTPSPLNNVRSPIPNSPIMSPQRPASVCSNVSSQKEQEPPYHQLQRFGNNILDRLKATDIRALNRRLRRTFDILELSNMSNSIIDNIIADIEVLRERFKWVDRAISQAQEYVDNAHPLLSEPFSAEDFFLMVVLTQTCLAEIGRQRMTINDLQVEYVKKVEDNHKLMEAQLQTPAQDLAKTDAARPSSTENSTGWFSSVFNPKASEKKSNSSWTGWARSLTSGQGSVASTDAKSPSSGQEYTSSSRMRRARSHESFIDGRSSRSRDRHRRRSRSGHRHERQHSSGVTSAVEIPRGRQPSANGYRGATSYLASSVFAIKGGLEAVLSEVLDDDPEPIPRPRKSNSKLSSDIRGGTLPRRSTDRPRARFPSPEDLKKPTNGNLEPSMSDVTSKSTATESSGSTVSTKSGQRSRSRPPTPDTIESSPYQRLPTAEWVGKR